MWNNSDVLAMVRDRSFSIGQYLPPRKPERPENNPLFRDRIRKEQIELREKLDAIQGDDTDDSLTGLIAKAQELGAYHKPIPRDHPYTKEEIGEYLEYLNAVEEWDTLRDQAQEMVSLGEPEIQPFTVLYSTEKDDFILTMSGGMRFVRELGLEDTENIIGGEYSAYLRYYHKATPSDIEDHLMNVDFEEIRKRLINAGYTNYVNDISNHLANY